MNKQNKETLQSVLKQIKEEKKLEFLAMYEKTIHMETIISIPLSTGRFILQLNKGYTKEDLKKALELTKKYLAECVDVYKPMTRKAIRKLVKV